MPPHPPRTFVIDLVYHVEIRSIQENRPPLLPPGLVEITSSLFKSHPSKKTTIFLLPHGPVEIKSSFLKYDPPKMVGPLHLIPFIAT